MATAQMSEAVAKPIPAHKIPFWHLLPFTIFALINLYIWIQYRDHLVLSVDALGPLRLIALALATYRIANIIANEQVFKALRAPFVNVRQMGEKQEEVPKRSGLRNTVGSLLYCPSCLGVWAAALLTYGLVFVPDLTWIVVLIFSLSAGERVLTNLVSLLDAAGNRLTPGS